MTMAPLVGRERELARIRKALDNTDNAMGGAGECLIIEGAPGIGKSRLLAAATAYATELGMATAVGQATELDHVAPLSTLLSPLTNGSPPVIDKFDQLGDPAASQFWLIDQLGERLERHVARRPLLIAIDNVQWADELSALALRLLVPSLASSPSCGFWLSQRTHPIARARRGRPADPGGRRAHRARPARRRRRARPVRGAARPGARPGPARAGPPQRRQPLPAGGAAGPAAQPGKAAVGLRRRRRSDGDGVDGADLPAGFVDAVRRHLHGLSPDAHRLLEAGAVLGRPFTVHEAAGLWGRRAVELVAAAEEAMQQDALMETGTELAFRHDLIRESVLSAIPSPVRRVLHREAVTVLRAENRPASEIAEHLIYGSSHWSSQAVDALHTPSSSLPAPRPVPPRTWPCAR
ncbi:ATP-binding protein [Streptacidiphilus sp. 4-A2]|nr:ATP-binding protein [Streptacidiphilus sp. 4-A2]